MSSTLSLHFHNRERETPSVNEVESESEWETGGIKPAVTFPPPPIG